MTDKTGFTKEQLIEHCKKEIGEWREADSLFQEDFEYPRIQAAALEIALAALTAEPIGWMDELTDNPAVIVAIPQRLMPEGK